MKTIRAFPEVEAAAAAFAALGSEQRLSVLRTLVRAGPAGLAMGELGERCGITGSTLSFHVRILVQAGLADQTREGRRILCAARMSALEDLGAFLTAGCCADLATESRDHG